MENIDEKSSAIRLITSWNTSDEAIQDFIKIMMRIYRTKMQPNRVAFFYVELSKTILQL